MPQLHIRSAMPSDVADIEAIVADAYGVYVDRMGRRPAPMDDDYSRLVGKGSVWVLVADEMIGGLIVLHLEPNHVLVDNVAVESVHQGLGYGRKLLNYAEQFACRNRVAELRLYTNELMHENLKLYSKLGWDEYDRAEQAGFRRVFMRKRVCSDIPEKREE